MSLWRHVQNFETAGIDIYTYSNPVQIQANQAQVLEEIICNRRIMMAGMNMDNCQVPEIECIIKFVNEILPITSFEWNSVAECHHTF